MALGKKSIRVSEAVQDDQKTDATKFGINGRHATQPTGAPYVITGPGGELSVEGDEQEDTIMGQDFRSNVPGSLRWNITTRALTRGRAGYFADIEYFDPGFNDFTGNEDFAIGQTGDKYMYFEQVGVNGAVNADFQCGVAPETELYDLYTIDSAGNKLFTQPKGIINNVVPSGMDARGGAKVQDTSLSPHNPPGGTLDVAGTVTSSGAAPTGGNPVNGDVHINTNNKSYYLYDGTWGTAILLSTLSSVGPTVGTLTAHATNDPSGGTANSVHIKLSTGVIYKRSTTTWAPVSMINGGGSLKLQNTDFTIDTLRARLRYAPTSTTKPKVIRVKYLSVQDVSRTIGCPTTISMSMSADPIDTTCITDLSRSSIYRYMCQGLKTVSIEAGGVFHAKTSGTLGSITQLLEYAQARDEGVWIKIWTTGSDKSKTFIGGLFNPLSRSQRGDVGAVEEETFNGSLRVMAGICPAELSFADGTGSKVLEFLARKFHTGEDLWIEYAPEGHVTGKTTMTGRGFVTDLSYTVSIDSVGEFSLGITGNGKVENADYGNSTGNLNPTTGALIT